MKHPRLVALMSTYYDLSGERIAQHIQAYAQRKRTYTVDWEGECERFRRIIRAALRNRRMLQANGKK